MKRDSDCGRSLVPSAALTMPTYSGGNNSGCSASTAEKRWPSRRPPSRRPSTLRVAGLLSFSSSASSASTMPRPAVNNASSSWLNNTNDSALPLPRRAAARIGFIASIDQLLGDDHFGRQGAYLELHGLGAG